jgi:hypothetical protein
LSWETQNEIINACGLAITRTIVSEIKSAGFFSVLVDDTTDAHLREQCSISARYFKDNKIVERFLLFYNVSSDLSAKGIATCIVNNLHEIGLSVDMIRGQGYDGASTMSGKWNGVQAEIKKLSRAAPYVHCNSHVLNLATQSSSAIPLIRNTHGQVMEVSTFFRMSAKRMVILQNNLPSVKTLMKVCPTRWVEGHAAHIRFTELLEPIVRALEVISEQGGDSGTKATSLVRSLCSSDFLVAIHVMNEMAALLLPLSKALQTPAIDLLKCMAMVDKVTQVLRNRRKNAVEEFRKVFIELINPSAVDLDVLIKLPRRTGRQTQRENHEAANPEEFYK